MGVWAKLEALAESTDKRLSSVEQDIRVSEVICDPISVGRGRGSSVASFFLRVCLSLDTKKLMLIYLHSNCLMFE